MASSSPGNTSTGDTSLSMAKGTTTVESTDAGWQTPGRDCKLKATSRSPPASGGHGHCPGRGEGHGSSGQRKKYRISCPRQGPMSTVESCIRSVSRSVGCGPCCAPGAAAIVQKRGVIALLWAVSVRLYTLTISEGSVVIGQKIDFMAFDCTYRVLT